MKADELLWIWDADAGKYTGKKEYLSKNFQEFIDVTVARSFGIPTEMLFIRRRFTVLVGPRYVGMIMANKFLKLSATYVTNYYGMYKHSVLNHARRMVQNKIDTDKVFASRYRKIEETIKGHISLYQ